MDTSQSSHVLVESPQTLKHKGRLNIEIRNNTWYLLPGTILCATVSSFQEHTRRRSITPTYGKEIENGEIEIIKEFPVPNALSAWHLIQGNNDGTPRFNYKIVQAKVREEVPKFNIEIDKDNPKEDNPKEVTTNSNDEMDELEEKFKKNLFISRCPPHLMRPHPTIPLLYCEHGCGHIIKI